ncbi:unnamed protein product [Lactuca saligna]|uniref:Uncharacterized protein n=1 Tax=Lactuca saligna TaxID=75948 RepID=A0AA36EFH3_LACSI|nr:unnamed protein product [Lactuca saligna]
MTRADRTRIANRQPLLAALGRHQFSDSADDLAKRNYANNVSEYNTVIGSLTSQRRVFYSIPLFTLIFSCSVHDGRLKEPWNTRTSTILVIMAHTSYSEKASCVAECCLCGGNTDAFRKSTDGQWVHAFCAEAETQKHGVEEWNSLKKVRVVAKILQDAVHGKNYKSDQDSGARRLCDAIVLGGIKDNEKAMVLNFGGQSLGWNLKEEHLPPGWICLVCGAHDNQQELPHNFKKMAKYVYTPDVMEASDCMLDQMKVVLVSFFKKIPIFLLHCLLIQEEIYVARAPGRLDVVGGIVDYSGSLVLQAQNTLTTDKQEELCSLGALIIEITYTERNISMLTMHKPIKEPCKPQKLEATCYLVFGTREP